MHLSARESVEALRARAREDGVAGDRRGDAAPPRADRRGRALARPEPEDEPAARRRRRPRRARRGAARRHDRLRRDRPRAARAQEKDVPFEEAPFGVTGLETAFAALHTHLVVPGLSRSRRCSSGCRPGPARAFGLPGAADRGRRAGEPRRARPRRRVDGDRGRLPLALGELVAARRSACAARVVADGRRRAADGVRRVMSGYLLLEDGTVFRGESVGAPGDRVRRGGLHDRDDRLPGDRHRPELRRAARLLHGADGRQLRRRRERATSRRARTRARC